MSNLFLLVLALFLFLAFGYPFAIFLLHCLHFRVTASKNICSFRPRVSIVIPTVAGGIIMKKKIENTTNLKYPPELVEVIVVDSSDNPFPTSKRVKIIRQRPIGKPAALNCGIKASRNEIIVITDDDATLAPESLAQLILCFSNPNVGGVVGDLTLAGESALNKMNSAFYSFFRNSLRRWESSLDSVSFTSGELLAFRKSIVSHVDPEVLSDDLYLLFEIRKKGYRVVTSDARVHEEDVPSLLGHINHKRRTMIGTLQVLCSNRKMLFNPRYGFFGGLFAPMYLIRIIFCPILLVMIEILLISQLISLVPIIGILLFVCIILKRDLVGALMYGFVAQIAALIGIIDFITGNYRVGWSKKGK